MSFASYNGLSKAFPHSIRLTRGLTNKLTKLGDYASVLSRVKPSCYATPTRFKLSVRHFSFCWGGRKLDEIVKLDLLMGKEQNEVELIWKEYHKGLTNTVGSVLSGEDGMKVLSRAQECSFFVQPIFREGGFFTLVSQFQSPSYFLLAYLEDYKSDASTSQPLIAISVYNDLASTKHITLIRGEVINKGILLEEGEKVIQQLIEAYRDDHQFYAHVRTFNKKPSNFNYNDFMEQQRLKWT
jgi:ATP synthase F1 complex assembly factor 1